MGVFTHPDTSFDMRINWKRAARYVAIIAVSLVLAFISFILYETRDEVCATPENIAQKLEDVFNEAEMAGFAVAVFSPDTILYQGALGWADVAGEIPYRISQQQYVASIAKTTIGIALLKSEELGLLQLDDPVDKHLPFAITNPNFPETDITIRQLATHTSSLDYNEAVVESLYIADTLKDMSLSGFMEAYFVNGEMGPVAFSHHQPGTHWNYSNIGAGLAAYIIERSAGTTFADFCQTYIFAPLNMQSTAWVSQDSSIKYYEPKPDVGFRESAADGVQLYPARDLFTSVADLTSYCQAVMRHDSRLLTEQSFQRLLSPGLGQNVLEREADNSGVFWMIDRNQYGITYQMTGMNGGDSGINTMMWFDPETALGYIFIGNTGASERNQGSHIWIYRTLVSLGDHFIRNNPELTLREKMAFKWHNYASRIGGLF